jgi:hypothetical protein
LHDGVFTGTHDEVARMIEYVDRYGLLSRHVEPEELFHSSTLST